MTSNRRRAPLFPRLAYSEKIRKDLYDKSVLNCARPYNALPILLPCRDVSLLYRERREGPVVVPPASVNEKELPGNPVRCVAPPGAD